MFRPVQVWSTFLLATGMCFCQIDAQDKSSVHRNQKTQSPASKAEFTAPATDGEEMEKFRLRLEKIQASIRAQCERIESAIDRLAAAQNQLSSSRELAAEYLDPRSGVPQMVADLRIARANAQRLADPIRAHVQSTSQYKEARQKAEQARRTKIDIRSNMKLSQSQIHSALARLNTVVQVPESLERESVNRDPKAREAQMRVSEIERRLAQRLSSLPKQAIESNANYVRAVEEYSAAKDTLAEYKTELDKLESEFTQVSRFVDTLQNSKERASEPSLKKAPLKSRRK